MFTQTASSTLNHERILAVQRYIRANLDQPLRRDVLASVAGFSIPHFHRVFTSVTGESAGAYVRRIRLERAGYKLRFGAIDIMEVAMAAGYDSHAAFSKAFKKQYGCSPSDFRNLGCFKASQLLREGKHP